MRSIYLISGGVAAGLALLAGCAVGPDYKTPATTMPPTWAQPDATATVTATTQPAVTSRTTTAASDLSQWWMNFKDPTLNLLVEEAMRSNLPLQQAEARIRQARANRGVTDAAWWPNVEATADYRRTRTPNPRGGGIQSDQYRAGFDSSWEVDVFGGTRRAVEAADADIIAAVEDRRDVMVTLLGDVALNYIDLRGVQERIAIANRNLQAQEHTADVTRRQFAGGFVSGLDVANAEAQVATTRAAIPQLESQAQQDIHALAVLLGRQPGELRGRLMATAPLPTTPPEVPVGLPSELLRRRPDIRRSEAQVHSATAHIGVATADLFPRFSLTGDIAISAANLSGLSNLNNHTWGVGPSMTWEIFSAGRVQSSIKVQEALRDESTLAFRQTVLNAVKEVEDALVAYAKEQQHRAALADSVTANRRAVDLSNRLYEVGNVDFLNVLNAERSLYAAEEAYSQSTRNIAADLVSLYKALGGGWEHSAYPATQPTKQSF